ncbi:UDP-Glycosyltransferase/glycogen phosphorylase [Ophiobolus disseminans]|uniref:UDP-Glycosyltransferase/glycogen phosphorylase n=1 Tax=Ophiobolus disseminans TaxID=1469910 RepID=A0A6A6ZGA0_9PLEO|nr:UDP-Glycosyltransferase/glycogen phosphorylase [Ophiobolus disseminans]
MSSAPILFLTNSELGQASVILAVAEEVALTPGSRVHVGSFSSLAGAIPDGIKFHSLPGRSMKQVFASSGLEFLPKHRPGVVGTSGGFAKAYSVVLAPWTASEYFSIFDACCQLLKDLEPSLVVLDPLFSPAYDAALSLNRRCLVLSPNTFKDHATGSQPGLNSIFKLPCLGSGYSTPMGPLTVVFNVWLLIALHVNGQWSAPVKKLEEARKQRGIQNRLGSICMFDEPPTDLIFLVQSTPESDFPLHVPSNLLGCGPILPSFLPLAKTHAELASWLNIGPTIVINMGSHVTHANREAGEIMTAVLACMQKHEKLQVLWKLQSDDIPDVPASVQSRLRIMSWLPSTPAAILTASTSVCAYVYHGGSNSFHEAVAAGVPHVVCPVWLDTYDFATRVEHLGIGLWANRGSAPDVDSTSLQRALEEVIGGAGAEERRKKARSLAKIVGGVDSGRRFAANRILDATA